MSEPSETLRITLADGIGDHAVAQLRYLLQQLSGACAASGPETPIIAPAMLLGDPAIAEQTQDRIPPQGQAVLHESQTFRRFVDVKPTNFRVIDITRQKRATSVQFDFRVFHDQQSVAEMTTRLQFVTPDQMRAMRGTGFSERLNSPDAIWTETAEISAQRVQDYLDLAHDPNPIHRDDAAAQAAGFDGAVVPGMLLCGLVEMAVVEGLPTLGIREMKVRFMAAVDVGEFLKIGVLPRTRTDAGQVSGLRVFAVTQAEQIALIADVQLTV